MAEAGDPGDTFTLALEALRGRLRRASDARIEWAMAIAYGRLLEWPRERIERELGLTSKQYDEGWQKLRWDSRPGADEQ